MDVALSQLEQRAMAQDFSGAVRVQHQGEVIVEFACGHSDRTNERINNLETRFAVASGTKSWCIVWFCVPARLAANLQRRSSSNSS